MSRECSEGRCDCCTTPTLAESLRPGVVLETRDYDDDQRVVGLVQWRVAGDRVEARFSFYGAMRATPREWSPWRPSDPGASLHRRARIVEVAP